jgi:hypothetical protein
MEPEGCGANGQIFVDDEHFGFEKRGHAERQTNCPATWQKTGRNAARAPQERGSGLALCVEGRV